jgi:hypothetical protein
MDASVVKPVAEATKAVAETSGKAIDATSAFAKIFKGPVAELIGCVEDKFKYVRWERRQALIAKSEAYMRSKGLSAPTRALPLPFSVPLLTAGLLEEDDELQEIWARLLVNAGDASTAMDLRTAYVEMLRGMSAFDVKVLSKLAETKLSKPPGGIRAIDITTVFPEHGEIGSDEISPVIGVSLANLARLGCAYPSGGFDAAVIFRYMTLTDLGMALYNACS